MHTDRTSFRILLCTFVAAAVGLVVVAPAYGAATSPKVRKAAIPAAASAVSKTVTVTRVHLVNGADQVADTRNVTVSVDVTTNLRNRQPVNVSWSGAHPTGGFVTDPNSLLAASLEYPVVIMECRGIDSASVAAAKRIDPSTCWTQVPDERMLSVNSPFPPFRVDRYASSLDRQFRVGIPDPVPAACVGTSSGTDHWVPFVTANGTVYPGGPNGCGGMAPEASVEQAQIPENTTYASTDLSGNGAAKFVINTAESNASLGCSSTVPCSLVVIPIMGISCDVVGADLPAVDQPQAKFRAMYFKTCSATGHYDPAIPAPVQNGSEDMAVAGELWWSASNWRNRISFPLSFVPPSNVCDLASSAAPSLIYGSQALVQATLQWQPTFCTDPKLFRFQHVQTSEPEAKNLLNVGNISAAFAGAAPLTPFTKPIVQAPIAVSGFAIAFSIDGANGQPLTTLNLTPRLLAKLLTQSYASNPTLSGEYIGVRGNPLDLGRDPEFRALNPALLNDGYSTVAASTLFTVNSDSDMIRSLTAYLAADPEARAFINGQPDPWGMRVNPNYDHITLPVEGWTLRDSFISPYTATINPCIGANPTPWLNLAAAPVSDPALVSLNMQFAIANSQIVCTNPGQSNQKLTSIGRETPTKRFVLGLVSLADASRYQFHTASLQSSVASGSGTAFTSAVGRLFVAPTVASLRAALKLFQPVKAVQAWPVPYDLLASKAGSAGYPGTMIFTLDVPTQGLAVADAQRFATLLDWTTTTGQSPGPANGQLPGGFLPLTLANGAGSLLAYDQEAGAAILAQQGYVPAVDGSSRPPTPSPTPAATATSSPVASPTPTVSVTPSALPSMSAIAAVGQTAGSPQGGAGLVLPALLVLALVSGIGTIITGFWSRA